MLDQGHAGFLRQARDQALAAPGHDDVDMLGHGDELAHGGAVGGGHDLHGFRGQAGSGQAGLHHAAQGDVRVQRFAAAAQDGGIA
ncbi:hypothetical protein D3C80_2115500 [compost metagenome]